MSRFWRDIFFSTTAVLSQVDQGPADTVNLLYGLLVIDIQSAILFWRHGFPFEISCFFVPYIPYLCGAIKRSICGIDTWGGLFLQVAVYESLNLHISFFPARDIYSMSWSYLKNNGDCSDREKEQVEQEPGLQINQNKKSIIKRGEGENRALGNKQQLSWQT